MCEFQRKIERVFYISALMVSCGADDEQALITLQDELRELEAEYKRVAPMLEEL